MFDKLRRLVRRVKVLGVEVEFQPPAEGTDNRALEADSKDKRWVPANLAWLHVSAFPLDDFEAHDVHEVHKGALGIFISNAGTSAVTIHKAYFLPDKAFPVYPHALRSSEPGTFEIKFGDQWREHSVKLDAGTRVLTYMPLQKPVPEKLMKNQKCGQLYLEYKARGKSGLHVAQL